MLKEFAKCVAKTEINLELGAHLVMLLFVDILLNRTNVVYAEKKKDSMHTIRIIQSLSKWIGYVTYAT
jgi:hypothetical protein